MNTNPLRSLFIFLAIFISVIIYGFDVLKSYFIVNMVTNGIVVTTGLIGMVYILSANIRLQRIVKVFKACDKIHDNSVVPGTEEDEEVSWDSEYEGDEYSDLMSQRGNRLKYIMSVRDVEAVKNWTPSNLFNAEQAESIMSAVRLRMAEVRNFSNYFSGILIILGLLGTFLGLLETIKSIGEVFSGDSISFLVADKAETSADDILKFFDAISAPLQGMGVAFSSSLFGLSGSLIVGLFAFISARNQSFFMFDLFDWIKQRMDAEEAQTLNRSALTSLPSGSGLMGSLARGGMKLPQSMQMRSMGTKYGTASQGKESGGDFSGEFHGEFRGQGEMVGRLYPDELMGVLNRLEAISKEAVEKNGLLAKAALKLGENLALEQKRLADIANYEQQASVALAAIRQQGEHQIHLLNQQIEATRDNTDKEEFRALAAHFHRSFETLLGDVQAHNKQIQNSLFAQQGFNSGLNNQQANNQQLSGQSVQQPVQPTFQGGNLPANQPPTQNPNQQGFYASVPGQPVSNNSNNPPR